MLKYLANALDSDGRQCRNPTKAPSQAPATTGTKRRAPCRPGEKMVTADIRRAFKPVQRASHTTAAALPPPLPEPTSPAPSHRPRYAVMRMYHSYSQTIPQTMRGGSSAAARGGRSGQGARPGRSIVLPPGCDVSIDYLPSGTPRPTGFAFGPAFGPAFGAPRPREAGPSSPTESQRQEKAQRVDDGMEQTLVVFEAPTQHAASMQPIAPMQPFEAPQSSAVTIASTVTAAAADEGVDQPYTQPFELDAAPFDGGATALTPPQFCEQALADLLASRKQAILAHKQFLASSKSTEQDLRAALSALSSHAAPQPMQPLQQTAPKQTAPKQTGPKQTVLKQAAPKQPIQQPKQQPTRTPAVRQPAPLYAEVLAAGCGAMVSAMLPPAMQASPQWQQQPHQRRSQPSSTQHARQQPKQHTQHQPKRPVAAVGVDRFPHLLHFTLSGKGLVTEGSAAQVARRAVAKVEGGDGVVVVDAVRLGPAASPRFQFKVATVEQADTLIRGRGKAFAGSGVVLSEVLSPAETALHTQMYPDFLRLKAAGHRVQFRRARLFVDGQLWSKAVGTATA